MKEYDYSAIRELAKRKGESEESIAEKSGLNIKLVKASFNNKRDFRQSEILKISSVLDISFNLINEYFFKDKL